MSAPKAAFPCGECGKAVRPEQFHDYVECVRQKATVMRPGDKTVAMLTAHVDSLLAYIDSKEPQRVAYRHYVTQAAKFRERPALPPEDSSHDAELFP